MIEMNAILLFTCACLAADAAPRQTVVVVVGAEGTPEYGKQFREWAGRWKAAAERGNAEYIPIGLDDAGDAADRDLLKQRLTQQAGVAASEPLWLVLIGHGTFDGKSARFNLRGPDVAPAEIAEWLKESERPVAVVNCASCSSPFLAELSGPGRVVVTATKSGFEHNFARFGDSLSSALLDPRADLDKDDQVSLLEAYLMASAGVREFYEKEGRLATEHSLLDDNGDRMGTPADWFQGVRAVKTGKDGAALDGLRAAQLCLVRSRQEQDLPPVTRARRDQLEQELAQVRKRKTELPEDEYLTLLEPLLVELSRLYEEPPATDSKPARTR
ncbi:MAG: hypothetical protein HY290_08600 [Planctomycetia bacterium]|nr:hypothetical protein [Planctomycetia bacterium]